MPELIDTSYVTAQLRGLLQSFAVLCGCALPSVKQFQYFHV